jgi:ATP-binding cassette subfamily F protein 3
VLAQSDETTKANGAATDRPRRLNPIKQKQMEERCAFLEEETPRVEAAIAHTEQQLAVFVSASETARLSALADDLRTQLAALTAEWEDLMIQLEGQGAVSSG